MRSVLHNLITRIITTCYIKSRMKILTGYYKRYKFLYDLELTNRRGTKLYKKYIFEVDKFPFGYRIVDFYER